jgi:hypothetical protein
MSEANILLHTLPGLAAMNEGKPLYDLDKPTAAAEILARYEHGELMSTIATSIGLKGSEQLYRLLISTAPDKWKDYQAARAMRRLEDATILLETAPDGLTLSRAREQVKAAQWELERLLRRLYGSDAPGSSQGGVQINIGIGVRSVDETGDKTLTIDVPSK